MKVNMKKNGGHPGYYSSFAEAWECAACEKYRELSSSPSGKKKEIDGETRNAIFKTIRYRFNALCTLSEKSPEQEIHLSESAPIIDENINRVLNAQSDRSKILVYKAVKDAYEYIKTEQCLKNGRVAGPKIKRYQSFDAS